MTQLPNAHAKIIFFRKKDTRITYVNLSLSLSLVRAVFEVKYAPFLWGMILKWCQPHMLSKYGNFETWNLYVDWKFDHFENKVPLTRGCGIRVFVVLLQKDTKEWCVKMQKSRHFPMLVSLHEIRFSKDNFCWIATIHWSPSYPIWG